MLNYQVKDLVFHFNKKHLEDPSIPMWVVKAHGVTFYVNHVTANVPWSTKETPDNPSTKGSIKFKKCKLTIDDDNNAILGELGLKDLLLPTPKIVHARVISEHHNEFGKAVYTNELKHSIIKDVIGDCGSPFFICDLLDKDEVLLASLKYANQFRILSTNEKYYQDYENIKGDIDERDDDSNDFEDY